MKQLQPFGVRTYLRPGPTPKMPPGLEELMESMTREVLRHNPSNIYDFCSKHMENLIHIRDSHIKSSRPSNKLALENKIKKAQNKINERASQRRLLKEGNDKDNEVKTMSINNSKVADNNIGTINDTELFSTDKSNEEKSETSAINKYSLIDSIVHNKDYENNEVKEPSDLTSENNKYMNLQMKVSSVVESNKKEKENIEAFLNSSKNNEAEKQQENENECFDKSILNSVSKIVDDVDLNIGDIKVESVDTKRVAPLNAIDLPTNAFKNTQETIIKQDFSEIVPCENLNTSTEKTNEINDLSNKNDVMSYDTEKINTYLEKASKNDGIVKFENIKNPLKKLTGINDSTDEKNDEKKSDTNVDPNKEQIRNYNSEKDLLSANMNVLANVIMPSENHTEINDFSNNIKLTEDISNTVGSKIEENFDNLKKDLLRKNIDNLEVIFQNVVDKTEYTSDSLGSCKNEENIEDLEKEFLTYNIDNLEFISENIDDKINVNVINNKLLNESKDIADNENAILSESDVRSEDEIKYQELIKFNTDVPSQNMKNIPVDEILEDVQANHLSTNEIMEDKTIVEQHNNLKIIKTDDDNSLETKCDLINRIDDSVEFKNDFNKLKNDDLHKYLDNSKDIERNIKTDANINKNNSLIQESQTNTTLGDDQGDPCIPDVIYAVDKSLTKEAIKKSGSININESVDDNITNNELKQNITKSTDDNTKKVTNSSIGNITPIAAVNIYDENKTVNSSVSGEYKKENIQDKSSTTDLQINDDSEERIKTSNNKSKDDNTTEVINSSKSNITPIDAVNIDDQNDTVNTSVGKEYEKENNKNESFATDLQINDDSEERNETESQTFNLENKSIIADGLNDLNSASIDDNSTDDNHLKKHPSMDLETAAITIQKVFRSFMFKSRASTLDEIPNYDESNDIPYMPLENEITCNNQEFITPNIDRRTLGISRMDTVLQTVNEEKSLSMSTDDSSTLSSAATTIQAHVRGFLVRNRLHSNKTNSNSSMINSDGLSMDIDNEVQKNKTILNIHIVPEGQFVSRDDSIGNAGDLSFDVSPRSSNLHPLGYDRNERRKQLKREDAIQSVSPPSNNSGKLSEDVESVKDLTNNETAPEIESTVQLFGKSLEVTIVKDEDNSSETSPSRSTTANTVIEVINNENVENRREPLTKMSSDEMDVVTPSMNNDNTLSIRSQSSRLIHSGEFHDMVLPTRVSRTESSVVREFQNAWVYFLRWNG